MIRRHRRLLLAVGALVAGITSIVIMADHTDRILVGDPAEYRVRIGAMLSGGWPYIDVPFEHLPVMLIPMFGAWFLGGSASQSVYVVTFAALMSMVLALTAPVIDSVGELLGTRRAGSRWLAMTLPLIPLVIFRNDPVVVLLFAIACLLFLADREGWVAWAVAGALAKGWPAALGLVTWRRHRLKSLVVAVSGAVAVGWTLLPGFTAARGAIGIHAETLLGSAVGLWRIASGLPSGVQVTTAAYLPVASWMLAANALVGVGIVVVGVRAVVRTTDRRSQFAALGVVVSGIILASQLFSLQYVLWLTPFLAVGRRPRLVALGSLLGALTLALGFVWDEALFDRVWLYGLFSLRNLMVLMAAAWLVADARAAATS